MARDYFFLSNAGSWMQNLQFNCRTLSVTMKVLKYDFVVVLNCIWVLFFSLTLLGIFLNGQQKGQDGNPN